VGIHLMIVVVFAAANRWGGDAAPHHAPERLTVRIIETAPKVPEPVAVEIPEPVEGPVAQDFPEKTPPKPAPPKPRKAPPAAPSRAEASEAPAAQPAPAAPRALFGLSLESTVAGSGPAFATGTSRMGQAPTAATAATGTRGNAAPTAPTEQGAQAQVSQRAAARIPTRDTAFTKPKRVLVQEPSYPPTLRAQGIEGDVLVRVHISAAGAVTQVSILQSSGHADFDRAAEAAAHREQFSPATRDGKPVPFTLSYSYRFRIED
jgi:protein TonB